MSEIKRIFTKSAEFKINGADIKSNYLHTKIMDSEDMHNKVSQCEYSAHFEVVTNASIILCFEDMHALLTLMKEYSQNYKNSFQHLYMAFNIQGQALGIHIYVHVLIYMQDSNSLSKHYIYTSKLKAYI
jgi:hypothetical protein